MREQVLGQLVGSAVAEAGASGATGARGARSVGDARREAGPARGPVVDSAVPARGAGVVRNAGRVTATSVEHDGGPVGLCFDIQRYSLHDGPGIRTTIFLKGCPLSCPWCHNPESLDRRAEIRLVAARCIRCGACHEACPMHLAEPGTAPDPRRCLRCGACAAACPTLARQLVGRTLTVAGFLDAVETDRPFYDESGGGVTFSGGEPLLQWRFLVACLAAARERELHTAVDTSGFASLGTVRRVAALADLFLFDLKVLDEERHRRFTGVPLGPILRNLRALDAAGAQVWLRMPLVPGCNDDRANLEAAGRLVAGLTHVRRLHLLPYRALGEDKLARLGREPRMDGLRPPTPQAVQDAAGLLRSFGIDVHVGG